MAASAAPKTFISDLRPSRAATIEATVVKLEAVREVTQRDGEKKSVRNGRLKDDTGEIGLVLWGDEVELIAEGERVRIVEGWVKDYQGRPQISLGNREVGETVMEKTATGGSRRPSCACCECPEGCCHCCACCSVDAACCTTCPPGLPTQP